MSNFIQSNLLGNSLVLVCLRWGLFWRLTLFRATFVSANALTRSTTAIIVRGAQSWTFGQTWGQLGEEDFSLHNLWEQVCLQKATGATKFVGQMLIHTGHTNETDNDRSIALGQNAPGDTYNAPHCTVYFDQFWIRTSSRTALVFSLPKVLPWVPPTSL